MAHVDKSVDLGFILAENDTPWKLRSHFFPSKVGGKPAWLAFKYVPSEAELKCKECDNPCSFLMQAYAPIYDNPACFHRTLFIFICRNPACCRPNKNKNLIVFRSQLSRQNEYYSDTAPDESSFDENSNYPSADKFLTLCVVCGCVGTKQCSKCHNVTYCSKYHQTIDWKAGDHKTTCGNKGPAKCVPSSSAVAVLFQEFELDYDKEDEAAILSEQEKTEEEKIEEYKNFLETPEGSAVQNSSLSVTELERMAVGKDVEDKHFAAFKERIKSDPEQVVRYQRDGQPLWITDKPILEYQDVPLCQYCGGQRKFEFQVMPQLLNYLDVDSTGSSIDWGTLVIYTCTNSCELGGQYELEFIWKQDFEQKQ